MGDAHQSPLCFHLLKSPQVESAEAHIVFDDPKDRFHFNRTGGSQALSRLAGEIGFSLAAVFKQAETNADFAIAFGACAFGFERALTADLAFVVAPLGDEAIVGSMAGSILELQSLMGWADELIFVFVIGEVLRQELAFA